MKLTLILTIAIGMIVGLMTGCPAPAANNANSANTGRMTSNTNTMANNTAAPANTATAPAGNDPIVGGAPMLKTKDIIDNALPSANCNAAQALLRKFHAGTGARALLDMRA